MRCCPWRIDIRPLWGIEKALGSEFANQIYSVLVAITECLRRVSNGVSLSREPRSLSENNEPTVEKLDLARFPDHFR